MALLLLVVMVFTYVYFAYLLHEWPPNLLCWDARGGFALSLAHSTKYQREGGSMWALCGHPS